MLICASGTNSVGPAGTQQDRSVRQESGDGEFVLAPHGATTQVELRMKLRPHGAMRLLQPLMRRKIGQFLADLPGHIQEGLDSADSRV